MQSRHDENTTGIPRWSAPWAAGWSAMSDISRIETDTHGFNGQAKTHRTHPWRRMRFIGLTAGALTAAWVAAAVLL